jgi:hypothetical protein
MPAGSTSARLDLDFYARSSSATRSVRRRAAARAVGAWACDDCPAVLAELIARLPLRLIEDI